MENSFDGKVVNVMIRVRVIASMDYMYFEAHFLYDIACRIVIAFISIIKVGLVVRELARVSG